METKGNKIKDNIKSIAYLAFHGGHKIHYFKDLEYDLYMSKQEIIEILKLFGKAKIFSYKFVPLENTDENYDFGSVRRRNEFRTGGFRLFAIPHSSKDKIRYKKFIENKLEGLVNSPTKLNDFVKKYAKYLNLPVVAEDSRLRVGKLEINLITGTFTYYNKKGNFSPKGQEYKMLYVLINSTEYQSRYGEILKVVRPATLDPESKANRDYLYTISKKIKKGLGILPKSKKSNKDLIKSIKNVGYQLLVNK